MSIQGVPLDVGVVQGSGLGPVMWNIYFAPVFDATQDHGIGFADDLNIASTCLTQVNSIASNTRASCAAARITMEPSKEVLTVFYPPRHPDRADDQPTTRLVGIYVDQDLNMKDHITKMLKNARVARTRLVRMRPYCTQGQLLSMYKTLIWSALEVGSVCYAHADSTTLAKLEKFQDSTLRQLGLSHVTIDSIATRRKVAHASMMYKQTVLGEGPDFIRANFPTQAPGPRDHLRRSTTDRHKYQVCPPAPPKGKAHLKRYTDFIKPLMDWNTLPPSIMTGVPGLSVFKKRIAEHIRNSAEL